MALHFTREEFARRQKAALAEMARQGLDGLLIFRQESMYYLTGYDTNGFAYLGTTPDELRTMQKNGLETYGRILKTLKITPQ